MPDKKKKFIIFDGNAIIHRSFHALPQTLTTNDGTVVNAVYGFAAVLLKVLREFKPDYIVLTLDRKEPTFRHKEYKEYKAKRTRAPQELYDQIPLIKELSNAFDIPIFDKPGFEADDLIGTICKKIDGGIKKYIVTGDLDVLQLVDDNTFVYTMSRGVSQSVTYDKKAVLERYGLKPRQMIDYKALRGDPSDNIVGVPGVGEKTSIALIKEFVSLDKLYKYIESGKNEKEKKIKPRVLELLKKHKNDALLSKRLVTIITDAEINFKLNDARFHDLSVDKITDIFNKFEFKSLLPRLYEVTGSVAKNDNKKVDKFARNIKLFNYNLVDNKDKFYDFLEKLKKQKEFAFDTETTDFNPINPTLLGVSFSWSDKDAYYLQIKNKELKNNGNLFEVSKDDSNNGLDLSFLDELRPILEDKKIKKFGHNIKYDIQVLRYYGINVGGVEFDTRIASYLLNPGTRQHNLDVITFSYFNHVKIDKDDLFDDKKKGDDFGGIPVDRIFNYSCEDADFTYRLAKKLKEALKRQELYNLFYKVEVPLISVLVNMEKNGVKIDSEFLEKKSREYSNKIMDITKKVWKLAGIEFNLNSTKQLREVLFEKMQISSIGIKRGKTGLSTSADELEKLSKIHPIIGLIQKNRELEKLKNTYIDALPKLVNDSTGRIHTIFNQTVTATGRLSSTNPNLQNIPVRSSEGKEIRKAFIAEKGYKLLSLDYSQIELRLAASVSGDKKMIKAFKDGADIHKRTAAEINQVSRDKVTSDMRREAKAINFGILYGQGPHGLSRSADISYERAREFIDIYFGVFNGLKKYIDKTIEEARKNGYVETIWGRRRYLGDINSASSQIRKAAERMAINAPMQGAVADMIKTAMIKVQCLIDKKYGDGQVKMISQVHDELMFEVREDVINDVVLEVKRIMENIIELKVPVIVDSKVGDNWGEMIEVKV